MSGHNISQVVDEEVIGSFALKLGTASDEGEGLVVLSIETPEEGRRNYRLSPDDARSVAMDLLHLADVSEGKVERHPAAN